MAGVPDAPDEEEKVYTAWAANQKTQAWASSATAEQVTAAYNAGELDLILGRKGPGKVPPALDHRN